MENNIKKYVKYNKYDYSLEEVILLYSKVFEQ